MASSFIKIEEREYETVFVGNLHYLKNPADWDEGWITYVMKEEGLEKLSKDHWKVINTIREHGHSPEIQFIRKVTGFSLRNIYELFPSGPYAGACRMAGFQRPPCPC